MLTLPPVVGGPVVGTLSAKGLLWRGISQMIWSYSAVPVGGKLSVTDDGVEIFAVDITAAGPGSLSFIQALRSTQGKKLEATLASGGALITGRLFLFTEDAQAET